MIEIPLYQIVGLCIFTIGIIMAMVGAIMALWK